MGRFTPEEGGYVPARRGLGWKWLIPVLVLAQILVATWYLVIVPPLVDHYYKQGVDAYHAHDYPRALDRLSRAQAVKANDARVQVLLGWVHWRLGHAEEAAQHFALAAYVVVSYYERYSVPLLGVKVLLVLWGADRIGALSWTAWRSRLTGAPSARPDQAPTG